MTELSVNSEGKSGRPRFVLGISDSHDAGAALLCDGRLVFAVNEERLNRRKMSAGAPRLSVESVLRETGIAPGEIECVALAGRIRLGAMPQNNDFSLDDGRYTAAQRLAEVIDAVPVAGRVIRSELALAGYRGLMPGLTRGHGRLADLLVELGLSAPVAVVDHHDAHLAAAYYSGGDPNCLILSNDGFGDGLCCKVAVGQAGRLQVLSANSFVNSIGVYYNYVTKLCGFPRHHHAGKVTGLAAFGDPGRTIDVFRRLIAWDERQGRYVNHGPIFRNALSLLRRELDGVAREDIAAGMQRHLEDVLVAMARHWLRKTGQKRIALVGGVHANVKANQRIAAIDGIERLTVFPNMGDGGLAAGAAWLAWADARPNAPLAMPEPIRHVYLGPGIDAQGAERSLRLSGLAFDRPGDLSDALARRLAARRIVARADGAMEYGPRALGNRSILYAATDPAANTWLNRQLHRTEFMPFAPVIRAEDADRFLIGHGAATEAAAAMMTITYDVTERCRQEAPAVVHVDGTARPQVLRRKVNPPYYDILSEYRRRTGLSVLVNTSFNMHEEPIVCTADEAIAAFLASDLDSLALGPFVVDNPNKPFHDHAGAAQTAK